MDPVTQGVLGTTASQLVSSRQQKVLAAGMGCLSGMAPDLDVLIRSSNDPLLFLEYHRHFTHSLIFIPFGALLCAVVFELVFRRWVFKRHFAKADLNFAGIYLFCFAGYASHAVLDACTTYGTMLLWPFSDMRVAWNNVSVIDPLFTLPLLLIIVYALIKRSTKIAWLGTVYAVAYLAFGLVQNNRAESVAYELALSRGHTPINLGLKPSFANLLVWKSVYEYDGRYYVDAIRASISSKIYPGSSTPKLEVARHFSWLNLDSQQAADIERFRWFSADHLGVDPANKNRIIDIRYSLVPNRLDGMWGIVLDPNATPEQHVKWTHIRPKGAALKAHTQQLWGMILGQEILP